jgi:tetratricopeptide (TPR) repeat protein
MLDILPYIYEYSLYIRICIIICVTIYTRTNGLERYNMLHIWMSNDHRIKTICLNMIVKNESHIIETTLHNITNHIKIDYWVISDTGSTDNTIDIIVNYFNEKKISGEIFRDKWVNFGHNRTKAIEHAYEKTDYLFIFDADDLIQGEFVLPENMNKDMYHVPFESPVLYHRPILVSNRMKWKYSGVLHEYLVNIDPIKSYEYMSGNFYIQSRRLGARNHNPNKYLDDAILLEKGYHEENIDIGLKNRYSYYCAQSYQDAGNPDKAIEWYENTLVLDFHLQYKYCACIRAGDCYYVINRVDKAIEYWGKAYEYDHARVEGVVKIMEYFYTIGLHFIVLSLYNKFKHITIGDAKDKIFLDHSKYHDLHYYASISGWYCNEHSSAYEACKYLLLNNRPHMSNTIFNLQFYIQQFKQDKNRRQLIQFFIDYIPANREILDKMDPFWDILKDVIRDEYPDRIDILACS